jgi:catechol 2,3-dioxygenase-like lactoylglutathione lyase family enzyme
MEGDFFAGVPVRDRAESVRWYEALLGSRPAFFPNEREAVWQVGEHHYVYVDERADHAGHAMHTIFVPDLASCLSDIERRGLRPVEVERYENGVSKAVFRDPDGNELGFAGMAAADE